jgi:hypothetical protein
LGKIAILGQPPREGGKHSGYTNDKKVVPVRRHRQLDRITANELCKQAGLDPKF